VLVVGAVLIWFGAPLIARVVTPRADSSLNVAGLSRYDLYCFAFVYLGLNTILAAIAPAITEAHQFLAAGANQAEPAFFQTPAAYRLAGHVINVVAGSAALMAAPRWGKMLLATEMNSRSPEKS